MADINKINNDGRVSEAEYWYLIYRPAARLMNTALSEQRLIDRGFTHGLILKASGEAMSRDELVQELFKELAVLEKRPTTAAINESRTTLRNILQGIFDVNAGDPSAEVTRIYPTIFYALIQLEIIAENYTAAKELICVLDSRANDIGFINNILRSHGLGNMVNDPDWRTRLNLNNTEFTKDDKRMWLVSMLAQLAEKGVINVTNDTNLLKVLNNATGTAMGFAKRYISLKLNPNKTALENLYTELRRYNTLNTPEFLIRLKVLSEILSADPNSAYVQDILNINGIGGLKPSTLNDLTPKQNDFDEIVGRLTRATPRTQDQVVQDSVNLQIKYDTCVQYYLIYLQYLQNSGNFVVLENWLRESSTSLTKWLKEKEGSYFGRELNFAQRQLAILRITRGNAPVNGLGNPPIDAKNNAERQRMYYIESEEDLLRKDTGMFLARTFGNAARGVQTGVLNDRFELNSSYMTGTAARPSASDQQLLLNARCGAIECYLKKKDTASAQEIYKKILSGKSISEYLQGSSLNIRFLFVAGQIETDKDIKRAIYEKILSITSATAEVEEGKKIYAYFSQNVRDHWTAQAFLAFLNDQGSINKIEAEHRSRSITNRVEDAFFIEEIYKDIKYIILLQKLDKLKADGKWEEGLAELRANADLFTVADDDLETASRQLEYDFQTAEFENLRYVYSKEHTQPTYNLASLSSRAANDPANRQRLFYIEATVLAYEEKYSQLLAKAQGFITCSGNTITVNLGAYEVRESKDVNKTPAEYNIEFRETLVCTYLEILDHYQTKKWTLPLGSPANLKTVFETFFGTDVSRIRNKTGEWIDRELRIMMLAAKYDPAIYTAIRNRTQYNQYKNQVTGPNAYRYHSPVRRAYWEATLGQVYAHAKNKDIRSLEVLLTEIKGEYRSNSNAADKEYIQKIYWEALLSQTYLYGERRDQASYTELQKLFDEIVREKSNNGNAKRIQYIYIEAALAKYNAGFRHGAAPTKTQLNELKSLTLDNKQELYLLDLYFRLATDSNNENTQNDLDELIRNFGLDTSEDATKKILYDLIVLNKIIAARESGSPIEVSQLYTQLQRENLRVLTRDIFQGNVFENLNKLYGSYRTEMQPLQYFASLLLQLAKMTAGPVANDQGDDDPAELLLERIIEEDSQQFDIDFYAQLKPRLRLDFSWGLLSPEEVSETRIAIAERIARAEWNLNGENKLEAEDMLRLAWAKRKDVKAITGEIDSTGRVVIAGYPALLSTPPNFKDNREVGAAKMLLGLYYTKKAGLYDIVALRELIRKIEVYYEGIPKDELYREAQYIKTLLDLEQHKRIGDWEAGLRLLTANAGLFMVEGKAAQTAKRQLEKQFQQAELETMRYVYGTGAKPAIPVLSGNNDTAQNRQRQAYIRTAQQAKEDTAAGKAIYLQTIKEIIVVNGNNISLNSRYVIVGSDEEIIEQNREFLRAMTCAYLEIQDWYETEALLPEGGRPASLKAVYEANLKTAASEIKGKSGNWEDGELRIMFLAAKYEDSNIYEVIKNRSQYKVPADQSGGYRYQTPSKRAYWEALLGQFYVYAKAKEAGKIEELYERITREVENNRNVTDVEYIRKIYEAFEYNKLLNDLDVCKRAGDWEKGLELLRTNGRLFTVVSNTNETAKRQLEKQFQQAELETMRYVYGTGAKPAIPVLSGNNDTAQNRQRQAYIRTAQQAKEDTAAGKAIYLQTIKEIIVVNGNNISLNSRYVIAGNSEDAIKQNMEFLQAATCAYLEILDWYGTEGLKPEESHPTDLKAVYETNLKAAIAGIKSKSDNWTDSELRIMFLAAKYEDIGIYEIIRIRPQYQPAANQTVGYRYHTPARRAYWEALLGQVYLYAYDASYRNYPELEKLFNRVSLEYKGNPNVPDRTYMQNIYIETILAKYNADLKQNKKLTKADLEEIRALPLNAKQELSLLDLYFRLATAPDNKNSSADLAELIEKFDLRTSTDEIKKILYDFIILNKVIADTDSSSPINTDKLYLQLQGRQLRVLTGEILQGTPENVYRKLTGLYESYKTNKRQLQYFASLLLQLAKITAGPAISEEGDDDPAERVLERILLEDEHLFEPDFYSLLKPRLRLDCGWGFMSFNEPGDARLAVAQRIAGSVFAEAEDEDTKFEATSLKMLAYIKDVGDRKKVEEAVIWYETQLKAGTTASVEKTAKDLLPVTYAYVLRDYKKALEFIEKHYKNVLGVIEDTTREGSRNKERNLQIFAIVVDCWVKQKQPIKKDYVDIYTGYIPNDNKDRIAQASIIFNYVTQEFKNKNLAVTSELAKINLPTDPPEEIAYIETKTLLLRVQYEILNKNYAQAAAYLDKIIIGGYTAEKWQYLRDDFRRMQASVKEEQGYYSEALKELTQINLTYIKDEDEQAEINIYDNLQRAGIYIKQGNFTEAEKLLPLTLPANWLDDQKEIYYSRRIAIASAKDEKNTLENLGRELTVLRAEVERSRDPNKNKDLFAANLCEVRLARLDPDNSASRNLELARDAISKLPKNKQADYASTLDQLSAYQFAEFRTLTEQAFPSIDPKNGLIQIQTSLTWHYAYLSILNGDNALEQINAGLDRAGEALAKFSNNEGLANILHEYQARLYLLKYNFFRQHYAKDDLDTDQTAAKENFDKTLLLLPKKTADALQKDLKKLQTAQPRRDMPAYTVLEQEFDAKVRAAVFAGEFWDDKRKLDELLDAAVAVRHLFDPLEIIQAVNTLYDLGLENNFPQIKGFSKGLVAKVVEFRDKHKELFDGGFTFTDAEKGYGYFLLLRLLQDTESYSKIRQEISKKNYDKGNRKYYPESSALIINYLRGRGEDGLPEIKYVTPVSSLNDALSVIGQYLQDDKNLNLIIQTAEDALGLKKNSSGYTDLEDFEKDYLAKVGADPSSDGYEGYAAEKLLLTLLSCLIRQRAEGVLNWSTDSRVIDLFNILKNENYKPVNGSYFDLKLQMLELQYHTALDKLTEYNGYGRAYLPECLQETAALLEQRAKQALFAAERTLAERTLISDITTALTWNPPLARPVPQDKYILPEEAFYLYSDLIFRLAEAAIIAADHAPNRAQRSLYLERAKILQDILKKLDPKNTNLNDIAKNIATTGKIIKITPQYNFSQEQKADGYPYFWEAEGYRDTPNIIGQKHDVSVEQSAERQIHGGQITISTDLWKNIGLFPSLTIGGGTVQNSNNKDVVTGDPEISGEYKDEDYKTPFFTVGAGLSWHPWQDKLLGKRFLIQDSELGFNTNWRFGQSRLSPFAQFQWAEAAKANGENPDTNKLFPENSAWYEAFISGVFALRGLENIALGLRESAAISTFSSAQVRNDDNGFGIYPKTTTSFVNKLTIAPQFNIDRFGTELGFSWLYQNNLTNDEIVHAFPAELSLNYYGARQAFGLTAGLDDVLKPSTLGIGLSWQSVWFKYGTMNLNIPISLQEGKIKGISLGFGLWL